MLWRRGRAHRAGSKCPRAAATPHQCTPSRVHAIMHAAAKRGDARRTEICEHRACCARVHWCRPLRHMCRRLASCSTCAANTLRPQARALSAVGCCTSRARDAARAQLWWWGVLCCCGARAACLPSSAEGTAGVLLTPAEGTAGVLLTPAEAGRAGMLQCASAERTCLASRLLWRSTCRLPPQTIQAP
jgi:hypothetical protein